MNRVWCPKCRKAFPQTNVCKHYKYYNYKPGENEAHFIELINRDYQYGDFGKYKRKQKRIGTSAGDTRTKNSICTWPGCKANLDSMTREEQEVHAQKHKQQSTLEVFN